MKYFVISMAILVLVNDSGGGQIKLKVCYTQITKFRGRKDHGQGQSSFTVLDIVSLVFLEISLYKVNIFN